MEYTVHKLAKLAGVSSRTLRYYDQIGLLKPARASSSGYRIYGEKEVDRLQQILFYRELGIDLESIRMMMTSPAFDSRKALLGHHEKLLEKRWQLDMLIANVEKTISSVEGGVKMSDQEKFEGFKQKMIEDNEKQYGDEIREKYGKEAVEQSYVKIKGMTRDQHDEAERLAKEVQDTLAGAMATGDPSGAMAQKAAELHKKWLMFYWGSYSKGAHAGLARMYVEDERFKAYYDQVQEGAAEFLRDAILVYTGQK